MAMVSGWFIPGPGGFRSFGRGPPVGHLASGLPRARFPEDPVLGAGTGFLHGVGVSLIWRCLRFSNVPLDL